MTDAPWGGLLPGGAYSKMQTRNGKRRSNNEVIRFAGGLPRPIVSLRKARSFYAWRRSSATDSTDRLQCLRACDGEVHLPPMWDTNIQVEP